MVQPLLKCQRNFEDAVITVWLLLLCRYETLSMFSSALNRCYLCLSRNVVGAHKHLTSQYLYMKHGKFQKVKILKVNSSSLCTLYCRATCDILVHFITKTKSLLFSIVPIK